MGKECRKCNITKEDIEFGRSKQNLDKLSSYCKNCERIRSRERTREWYYVDIEKSRRLGRENYHRHIKEYREKQKESRRRLRKLAFEAYSEGKPKCACCGETEEKFLSIDHINGGGTKERRMGKGGGHFLYRRLKKEGYPIGYQVLCYNCNFSKGVWGRCPHRN